MLPAVVASLAVLIAFASPAFSQETEVVTENVATETTTPVAVTTTVAATTSEAATTPVATTTSISPAAATVSESTPTTTTPTSAPLEGSFNSPCNATLDCQPHKSLECLTGVCHCSSPKVFDIRAQRCVIPLGKECDSSDILGENMCPEFAECFMDRCVCKTGYAMHTLTRCKSDSIEPSERKPIVLWPKPKEDSDEEDCNSENCDATKGLACQNGRCVCKDSKEVFLEEFGRCLNTSLQKTLKDALKAVATSGDDIKSFVKLLEKFDDTDQKTEGSDHYNSPVHQLLGLLGGGDYRATHQPSTVSQVAPPYSLRTGSDLYPAAQETVTESTLPNGHQPQPGSSQPGGNFGGNGAVGGGPGQGQTYPSPNDPRNHLSPVSDANAESSAESEEALAYSQESQDSHHKKPQPSTTSYRSLPLDNLHTSPQSQEPSIVQRQAPPYLQGEGIPLQGVGTIPGGNQFRIPIQDGYGGYPGYGLNGYGGYPGYGPGGFGGGYDAYGGALNGQGHLGGLGGPALNGVPHGVDPSHGHGPHTQAPPPPPPPPPPKEGLLADVAEFVGRSLKLVDRFIPLVQAINEALKKEGILKKDGPGLLAGLGQGRPFGDISKEFEDVKEGGILSGFARFVGILTRLRRRLLLSGDESIKKLLA